MTHPIDADRALFGEEFLEPETVLKADAEMAVALAYQRAADLANTTFSGSGTDAAGIIRMSILALAPAEPLAEVARLKEALRDIAGECGCSIARAALTTPEKDATP